VPPRTHCARSRGTHTVRAAKTEALVLGRRMDSMPIAQIADLVRHEVAPISDVRASATIGARWSLC